MSGIEEFIDASLFLGMHDRDESVRIACKNFFVARASRRVVMSLEQVGKCDDVVWQHGRILQDAYYPFMDNLHTLMRIERRCYGEADVALAMAAPLLQDVPVTQRLLLAMVLNQKGVLYTLDDTLLGRAALPARAPSGGPELAFPGDLEPLYEQSLALRFHHGDVSR